MQIGYYGQGSAADWAVVSENRFPWIDRAEKGNDQRWGYREQLSVLLQVLQARARVSRDRRDSGTDKQAINGTEALHGHTHQDDYWNSNTIGRIHSTIMMWETEIQGMLLGSRCKCTSRQIPFTELNWAALYCAQYVLGVVRRLAFLEYKS